MNCQILYRRMIPWGRRGGGAHDPVFSGKSAVLLPVLVRLKGDRISMGEVMPKRDAMRPCTRAGTVGPYAEFMDVSTRFKPRPPRPDRTVE